MAASECVNLYLRILEPAAKVATHRDLYEWLQGDIQQFIPHDVLISASGRFDTCRLQLDVISALPGVRSHLLQRCDIDGLLLDLFGRWVKAGRRPLLLGALPDRRALEGCNCPLHAALRRAQSTFVHGVRDARAGTDSLYIAVSERRDGVRCTRQCIHHDSCFILDSLVSQIDLCSRRVAALPGVVSRRPGGGNRPALTRREEEILQWMCKGKTNPEIATILAISGFTVKNHIQNIFQKIGASNRVQAVTRYRESFLAGEPRPEPARSMQ